MVLLPEIYDFWVSRKQHFLVFRKFCPLEIVSKGFGAEEYCVQRCEICFNFEAISTMPTTTSYLLEYRVWGWSQEFSSFSFRKETIQSSCDQEPSRSIFVPTKTEPEKLPGRLPKTIENKPPKSRTEKTPLVGPAHTILN
ncbi:hypothetical protein KY385_02340 [Candidatus Parcubacteria bacterium]|nr:hypothetical protein [Candidatus Parcubacteria bacterium]